MINYIEDLANLPLAVSIDFVFPRIVHIVALKDKCKGFEINVIRVQSPSFCAYTSSLLIHCF